MQNLDIYELQILPYWKLYDLVFREIKRPKINQYNIELFFDVIRLDINLIEEKSGNSILHYACMFNNIELVRYLIERGADVNKMNNYNYTPLHISCELNCDEIIKLLLENSADPNILNTDNENPLMLYVKSGKNSSVIESLIEVGTDIDHNDQYGDNVFERSITHNNIVAVSILIKHIDINALTKFGLTPLMYCVISNKEKMLRILLEFGADVNIKIDGKTAWDMAEDKIRKDFPELRSKN